MHADTEELYKHRLIQFCRFHPGPDQPGSAALLLRALAGMRSVQEVPPLALAVVYDLRRVTLEGIESALCQSGYHLDNSLLCKLKRALFYYTEETQRENLALTQEGESTQREVFVNRYQHVAHGCRDPQPEYWREYQ